MKSYQVFENAQPIKEVELDTPIPEGDEVLLKLLLAVFVILIFIFMMVFLTLVMGKKWPQGWYSLLLWVTKFLVK